MHCFVVNWMWFQRGLYRRSSRDLCSSPNHSGLLQKRFSELRAVESRVSTAL